MLSYLLQRLLLLLPTLLGVTCMAFAIIHLAPGDAWEARGPRGSPAKTVAISLKLSLPGVPSTGLIGHCQRSTGSGCVIW